MATKKLDTAAAKMEINAARRFNQGVAAFYSIVMRHAEELASMTPEARKKVVGKLFKHPKGYHLTDMGKLIAAHNYNKQQGRQH